MGASMMTLVEIFWSHLPQERAEERRNEIRDGMKHKMNVLWANNEKRDGEWTKSMLDAALEMVKEPIPTLEGPDERGWPPLITMSDKRMEEAYDIHLAEMNVGPPGNYKPLSELERRAFREGAGAKKLNEFFKLMRSTLFGTPLDIDKLWQEADQMGLAEGKAQGEKKEEKGKGGQKGKKKNGEKQEKKDKKEGKFVTTKEELEEMKRKGEADAKRTGKPGMMVEYTKDNGDKELV